MARGLSKSSILSGLQCPRRLWLDKNQPEAAGEANQNTYIFDEGTRAGEVACTLFPGGVLVEHKDDLGKATQVTAALLERGEEVLYEATFQHDGVLIRADILQRKEEGFRLIEVKASTSVKDYHITDAAVQLWVMRKAGYPVSRVEIAHIDNQFVYGGDGDSRGLFSFVDVTAEVEALQQEVPGWITQARTALSGTMPEVEPGEQCDNPFACSYREYCAPPTCEYPVTILPYGATAAADLMEQGYKDLREVPEGLLSNDRHERVRRITVSGKAELSPEARATIQNLAYPRYHLDFETVAFAVPLWEGTRPYQSLPFQWSCHIEHNETQVSHKEFLDTTGEAPMRSLAEALIAGMGSAGPVLMYSPYERTVIKGLIAAFPDLADDLQAIVDRLVDLLPIVREHYYHPAMKGSWSIKAVLPTIAPDISYKDLDTVQDGMAAGAAYRDILIGDIDEQHKQRLTDALLEYCKLDTEAMVRLVTFLEREH